MDVGKRFYMRMQIYLSIYLCYYSIVLAVLLGFYFDFFKNTFLETTEIIVLGFELVAILSPILIMIIVGTRINMETEN